MMFKKIIVPTDASEPSRRALRTAIDLAQHFGAEILLLHVIYMPKAYWGYTEGFSMMIPDIKVEEVGEAVLKAALEGIDTKGVKITTKYISGYPAKVIIDQVNEEKADLVVMGSRGQGAFAGAVLGSVSQRVLAQAQCPVFVVK